MSISQTKENIYNFLKQFVQPYNEMDVADFENIPNQVTFPFLTYSAGIENWRTDGLLQIRLWDKNSSSEEIYKIADLIQATILEGYTIDNLILYQGSPFVQPFPQADTSIKCLYINLQINFI